MKKALKVLWNLFGIIGAAVTGLHVLTAILIWRDGNSYPKYIKDVFDFGYNWSDSNEEEEA